MHQHSIEAWEHDHVFLGKSHERNERRTWLVVVLTSVMMIGEIVAGTVFGSMALLADGWHMSTHAAALAISAVAYGFARRHSHDRRFSYGTGKVGELAAFSSALILALIALLIAYESAIRLIFPVTIRFEEATVVAVIGLAVNLASAWLLFDDSHHQNGHAHHHDAGHNDDDEEHDAHQSTNPAHSHHHGDQHASHAHSHHHGGHDTNLRAAYLHVLADALTSVLAIIALVAGRALDWVWLDPVIGVVGALVIARWSWGLLRTSGASLLDMVPSEKLGGSVRERLEVGGDRVTDIHLWRLGPGHTGLTVSIVAADPLPPSAYKKRLAGIPGLSHVTVEVHPCQPDVAGIA